MYKIEENNVQKRGKRDIFTENIFIAKIIAKHLF